MIDILQKVWTSYISFLNSYVKQSLDLFFYQYNDLLPIFFYFKIILYLLVFSILSILIYKLLGSIIFLTILIHTSIVFIK